MSPTQTTAHTTAHPRAAFPTPAWWFQGRDGRAVLAQPPNPALALWLVTVIVGWTSLLDGQHERTLTLVGQGALVAWALDELLRGASPVRRVLGAVVLVAELVHLFV